MATWPASLPQRPLQDGYSEELENVVITSGVDIGPAKKRRRTSAGVVKFNLGFLMSSAQLATFKSFFETDISYGAIKFTFPDPTTQVNADFRMDLGEGGPRVEPLSGGQYKVSFAAEKLP